MHATNYESKASSQPHSILWHSRKASSSSFRNKKSLLPINITTPSWSKTIINHIWMIIPHCLMWCIWRERNSRSFEDTENSMPDLKLFFFRTLLDWLSSMRNSSLFSVVDLLDLCNFCNWLFTPVYFLYTWVTRFFWIYTILLLIQKKSSQSAVYQNTPSTGVRRT